jgi:hypothetical protein
MVDEGFLSARYPMAIYGRECGSKGELLCRSITRSESGALWTRWSDWFAGLKLTHLRGNETLLSGPLPDQAALHGLLERIRDLNLTLLSVAYGGPSTQDSDMNHKEKS